MATRRSEAAAGPGQLPVTVRCVVAGEEVEVRAGRRLLGRLELEDWRQLGLGEGGAVDGALWPRLEAALRRRGAYRHALALLAQRDHARAALRRRLVARFGAPAADAALERLGGYLDDARYAQTWIAARQARAPLGSSALLRGLCQQGVPRAVAEAAVRAWQSAADRCATDAEWAACRRAAAARWQKLQHLPRAQAERRLAGFLTRRGFAEALVRRALRDVADSGATEA